LAAAHESLGARFVNFGGWEMPISYPAGTVAEHRACRSAAVAFDVSHLGTVRLEGPEAIELLQRSLTNDLRRIGRGRAQYTHLLDDADGSVLDDIIVWWIAPTRFDVMPNASNTSSVRAVLGGQDVTHERVVIAVQGPTAREQLASVSPEAAAVSRFEVATFDWEGVGCVAAGTGYTGEDGVECAIPVAGGAGGQPVDTTRAEAFWWALMERGVDPAGLGARDTLRLEAGLPLHGHELGPGITPLQAGLGWVVGWDKGPFRGREALEAERRRGVARRLRGLTTEGRQPPRGGNEVLDGDRVIGRVTSGNFSPVLERGIGMALLEPAVEPGSSVTIDVRGRPLGASVVTLPFVGSRATARKGS
jgi:aminomethyltransferase